MPRNRNYEGTGETTTEDVSAEEEVTAEPTEEEKESFTLPAEDEAASLVRPGIGMEDVPTPEAQPDPADYNDAVFAKKREAWEAANPEAVKQNQERDAAHEEGKPYQPETDES